MFELYLSGYAEKFLKKCDKDIYDRIMNKIKELGKDPFPSNVKRVVGRKEKIFRIRVGKYRILYVVFHQDNKVLISDIDKRSKVYR